MVLVNDSSGRCVSTMMSKSSAGVFMFVLLFGVSAVGCGRNSSVHPDVTPTGSTAADARATTSQSASPLPTSGLATTTPGSRARPVNGRPSQGRCKLGEVEEAVQPDGRAGDCYKACATNDECASGQLCGTLYLQTVNGRPIRTCVSAPASP